MPVINITETEKTSVGQFDATDNTVLIPMLYCRKYTVDSEGIVTYTEDEKLDGIEYKTAELFASEMSSKCVYVDGRKDRSYIMAYELLLQGLKVVIKPLTFNNADTSTYTKKGDYQVDISEKAALNLIEVIFQEDEFILKEFESRNIFNIKFVTSGAYPNAGTVREGTSELGSKSNIYARLKSLAKKRGDCIYLREFSADYLTNNENIIIEVNEVGADADDEYGACFIGWGVYSTTADSISSVKMPGCFGYLMAYATSIRNNADWFAVAGVIRGEIPHLIKPLFNVNDALMHTLQGDDEKESTISCAANCLYNAGSYGQRIWGNKVIYKLDSSSSNRFKDFLNVRILICNIKKQIYHTAMRLTFEPNDLIVWLNFKSLNNTLLDQMKAGRGIDWYRWTRVASNEKGVIKARLTIKPIEAVESFDIEIYLTEDEASAEEATNTI